VSESIFKQNPKVGSFGVRYRGRNKKFVRTLGQASYFEAVLPSGKNLGLVEFPAGSKVSEKKAFIQLFLYRLIQKQEERREAARRRYAQRRAESGKTVRSRRRKPAPLRTLLGTTERRVAELAAKYRADRAREEAPKLEEEILRKPKTKVVYDCISEAEWDKSIKSYERFLRKTDPLQGGLGYIFEVTSAGKAIPTRSIDGKKVRTMSWFEHQKSIGLITETKKGNLIGVNSIWWTVSRLLKRFKDKNYFELAAKDFGLKRELIFKVSLITNLSRHEGRILSSAPEYAEERQLPQEQTAQLVKLTLGLEGAEQRSEFEAFQAAVVKAFILTLYGPNVYQSASDKVLTSSDALFRLPLGSSKSDGKNATVTKKYRVAFTLNLMPESS
jgi:hypothetical protein